MTKAITSLSVDLGEREYPIHVGPGLLQQTNIWQPVIPGKQVLIVSNETVAPLYLAAVEKSLADYPCQHVILADGEPHKTLASIEQIFKALADANMTRDGCIVALGGGVIGDMAGFAAACWMRGIAFVQVPTTLLAMVDSSVGGKTGVNHPAGKNLIGAFHQPRAVIADTHTLSTLPEREFHAGLAEAIKHSALGDANYFAQVERHQEQLLHHNQAELAALIAHSCRFKASVVAKDEKEHGERALLNFGHTFGHALEVTQGYGTLLHGEAVAIGMCLAAELSARLGRADPKDTERLQTLLAQCQLPTRLPPNSDPDTLIQHMRLDKKNRAGQLRLILWKGLGKADIVENVDESVVREALASAVQAATPH